MTSDAVPITRIEWVCHFLILFSPSLSFYPLSRSLPPSFPSSRSNFLSRALSRQTGIAMPAASHEPGWPSSSPESGLSTQVGPATSRHRRQRLTTPTNTLIKILTFIGKTQLLLARLNALTVDEDINNFFYVFMCISGGIKGEHFYTQKTIVSLTFFHPPLSLSLVPISGVSRSGLRLCGARGQVSDCPSSSPVSSDSHGEGSSIWCTPSLCVSSKIKVGGGKGRRGGRGL